MPIHLQPSAPYAPDALLPGDPGRALTLAQLLLVEPKMSNHNRGLWGYYGETATGYPLTVQATGMGAPSAAIVLNELAELGVERAIRVGTCGALDEGLALGDVATVEAALAVDGTSRALGAEGWVRPDAELTEALARSAGGPLVQTASVDLFYEPDPDVARARLIDAGANTIEMEAAALFTLGRRIGVSVACALVISDLVIGERRRRIDEESLAIAVASMGRAAASALS